MADSLEDVLRNLAKRGELTHLSVTGPTSARHQKFRASFAPSSRFGVSFAEDEDPVKAILTACLTAKMKPQRQMPLRPIEESALAEQRAAIDNATDAELVTDEPAPADDVADLM